MFFAILVCHVEAELIVEFHEVFFDILQVLLLTALVIMSWSILIHNAASVRGMLRLCLGIQSPGLCLVGCSLLLRLHLFGVFNLRSGGLPLNIHCHC